MSIVSINQDSYTLNQNVQGWVLTNNNTGFVLVGQEGTVTITCCVQPLPYSRDQDLVLIYQNEQQMLVEHFKEVIPTTFARVLNRHLAKFMGS